MDAYWLANGAPRDGFAWHGPATPETRKAIVDPEQKLKQIWYLEVAVEVARSVARVVFPRRRGFASCSLVGPRLIMTNHHVFGSPADTAEVQIQFNYRKLPNGDLTTPVVYACDPDVFVTSSELDFTLVGLTDGPQVPFLRLRHGQKATPGSHIAIIQHPSGEPLQVALRDNSLVYADGNGVEYLTNTEYGSSGSPVFNDNWRVIALHSRRVQDPNVSGQNVWYRNGGTNIEAILKTAQVDQLIPA